MQGGRVNAISYSLEVLVHGTPTQTQNTNKRTWNSKWIESNALISNDINRWQLYYMHVHGIVNHFLYVSIQFNTYMLLNQLTVMLLNQLTYQLASIILWFLSKDFFLIVDSFQRFPGPKCTSLKKLDLVDCGWAMVLACSSLILATPRRCSILILALWVKYEQKNDVFEHSPATTRRILWTGTATSFWKGGIRLAH